MAKTSQTIRYNDAAIRPRRGGWQADIMRGGQRYRRQFGAGPEGLAQAKRYIDQIHLEYLANERSLTILETEHAKKALQLLPDNVSLLEAAEYYIERHSRVTEQPLIATAVERYVDEKTQLGRRAATIRSARIQASRLANDYPATAVNDLTRGDLVKWLESLKLTSPVTRNNYVRNISGFLNWCVDQGYAAENVAANIPASAVDDELPDVYDVKTVKRLMRYLETHKPRLVPFHALGFFSGVRTAELQRLTAEHIQGGILQVTPKTAKTRTWRYIEMEPNLRAWLEAYPPSGAILQDTRYTIDNARSAAKCWPWTNNVMRHSFATYHLAKHRNAALTAHDLGHPNAELVYARYRALAEQAQGDKYFAILPKTR